MDRDQRLLALFRAIAARDETRARQLLRASPELASEPLAVGAGRSNPKPFFLVPVGHYVYAGDTALHVAAAAYGSALADTLVAQGANVHARNRRGAEPLHYAADGNPDGASWDPDAQAKTIARLIRAGADPNATDMNGVTPLHRAVRTRCAAAVRALLELGADPARTNGRGSTPLRLALTTSGRGGSGSPAARRQQAAIVELLK